MADIEDFAKKVAERFCESQQRLSASSPTCLSLSSKTVEAFVRNVFYASLIPDEGRWPTACLMVYREGCERQFHFLFRPASAPSSREIAKLAHAVPDGSHLGCIAKDDRLSIAGIHLTVLNDRRQLGCKADWDRVGNPLKLFIRGPGHIEMATASSALVFKAGDITEMALFRDSKAIAALTDKIELELNDLAEGCMEAIDHVFNDLLACVLRLRHGGLILVSKEPKKSQFSPFREVDCLLLQELLLRYWRHVVKQETEAQLASSTTMIQNCLEAIAQMAGVDGAIVMNYECKVVAFNAIITRPPSGTTVPQLVDRDGTALDRDEFFRHRGTRHQSGFFYASTVPDSFAFVVSQDGGVSAFHNPGGDTVVCEPGMRILS